MWNFTLCQPALAPALLRLCLRLHPVSAVTVPHHPQWARSDLLSLPYQRPCPTTDARQALLDASWQVAEFTIMHSQHPHLHPRHCPGPGHQPVSLPGLTRLSFQLVSPYLPSCTLRSSYSHILTLLNTPHSLLPQGLCTNYSPCLQGSFCSFLAEVETVPVQVSAQMSLIL